MERKLGSFADRIDFSFPTPRLFRRTFPSGLSTLILIILYILLQLLERHGVTKDATLAKFIAS